MPIKNADDEGNPGGDTINSIKVIVTGDAAFVTNATASAEEILEPGAVKTFTPSFVVGPEAVDGQTYTVTLKIVSPDAGIDPDPDDPASDTQVIAPIADPYFSDGRKKLIFSDFSPKAPQKPGPYDIHNRKTHAISVTTGHGLAGVPA